ncbi:MAG: crossover junction endodeoxyribonuclease RuvC [Candidatus Pacebacteria bacterium]|nr:crossover junction endodeoxyribonuclease RuvC [Candidatus Paceibacterota bacterium]MDD4998867.1 crossover junction endodeoxyribonuclease RuvC [Candidatus Paceibacterota bacterium]
MLILGIDPGTTRIGWAILKANNKDVYPLDYGCWEISEKKQGQRLEKIAKNLLALIKKYQPEIMMIEKIFFFKNAKTAMSISEAKGVIIYIVQKKRLPYIELTPLEIKQNLVGYGRATKKDVQKTIQCFFSLEKLPKPDDIADALAVALAGFNKTRINKHDRKN